MADQKPTLEYAKPQPKERMRFYDKAILILIAVVAGGIALGYVYLWISHWPHVRD